MRLEQRIGPASLRAWGLVLNFFANGLLLYGAIGYVSDGSRVGALGIGALVSLSCVLLLSSPSR